MELKKDILLDDIELSNASNKMNDVSVKMNNLVTSLDKLLNELASGFNTDAGTKFIKLCREDLLKPMQQQSEVIKIISDTLNDSKNEYESVFEEYKNLNTTIKNL